MLLKYDINMENDIIVNRLQYIINNIYKLLPNREEGVEWQKPLETILEELTGIYKIINKKYSQIFFPLLSKLEGLYSLTSDEDFSCYRRIIFECLGLMNELQKKICQQNY